ncbi:hypothetical protein HNR19_003138 [Nocardioides thalensis]|uniref:Uncharacterized protein n=1 Tax=Nocardioides thalensis TaxID=1914755 RepID=A0A853C2M6_9ACTN|nr:hypothetical protein [Nocardioides thalensis]NYJ02440.1 hypothetical protein [Nocardioides thalensis]
MRNRADARWDRPVSRRHGKARRERGCGKLRFRDKREAVDFLHHADNTRHAVELDEEYGAATTLRVCRAYFCGTCRGYHVTSQVKPSPGLPSRRDSAAGAATLRPSSASA